MPGLNMQMIKELRIPLPILPEQQRIADILDRAEALRAKRRASLVRLTELTQALLRSAASKGDYQTIGKFVSLRSGFAFKSEDFQSQGCPVIRISNLSDGYVKLENAARVPEHLLGKGSTHKIEAGDIVIAMSGATTGKIARVPNNLAEPIYLNQRVGKLHFAHSGLLEDYLFEWARTLEFQKDVLDLAAGAAQPNISPSNFETIRIPIPPLPLQQEFARRVEAIDRLKAKHRQSLAEMDALFLSLQHRAFRGEL